MLAELSGELLFHDVKTTSSLRVQVLPLHIGDP